jgi:hypothetical protein
MNKLRLPIPYLRPMRAPQRTSRGRREAFSRDDLISRPLDPTHQRQRGGRRGAISADCISGSSRLLERLIAGRHIRP